MKVSITFLDGPRAEEKVEFNETPIRIGASLTNEVVVGGVRASDVAPVHAEISFECGFFVLYGDVGAGETHLNGRRVSLAKLKSGDVIRLGPAGPCFLFEGDPGFGGVLDVLTTSCRVNTQMLQAVVRDSFRDARSGGRSTSLAFVQEVMSRSRWQLGLRVAAALLVVLIAAGTGVWYLLSREYAEKATLRALIVRIQEEFRKKKRDIERSEAAFVRSAQDRERMLRHQIETLTRELRQARFLSQSAAEEMRGQVRRLREELGRTRKEILKDRSGRFIEVARENQKGVLWVIHHWALISEKTGKPLLDPRSGAGGKDASILTQLTSGSGFTISPKGWILTNRHVAEPWRYNEELTKAGITGRTIRISVVFADTNRERPARVLRVSKRVDLALLGISPFPGMPYLRRLNPVPEAARQGAFLAVLGFPSNAILDGFARTTLTTGVMSKSSVKDRLQFDASVHPGNSGGPVLNVKGEVIGIVEATGVSATGERLFGINYAVPIRFALDLVRKGLPG